jgi:hypothetical protein
MKRFAAAVLAASSLALTAPAAAVDPYEIDGILPLTGNIAFVGQTELQALKGVEAYINRTGGINGRPIVFNILDDQNDPKTSVLLTQQLIAKNVPVIFGPSSPQSCAAVQPLIKSGPVQYCIAQAGTAPPGSYQFFTDPYDPAFAVTWRFFRERGWRKNRLHRIDRRRRPRRRANHSRGQPRDEFHQTTATQLRDYLDGLRGWVGVNGPYDFRAMPQRGLTENSLLIVRWDPARNTAVAVSKFGGAALPVKN